MLVPKAFESGEVFPSLQAQTVKVGKHDPLNQKGRWGSTRGKVSREFTIKIDSFILEAFPQQRISFDKKEFSSSIITNKVDPHSTPSVIP
jgi:hypothetical protein